MNTYLITTNLEFNYNLKRNIIEDLALVELRESTDLPSRHRIE